MDDLISRAAALEVIDAVKGIVWSQSGKVLCGKIYSQIKDIPAVDAAPVVHGKWIKPEHSAWSLAKCSVCGETCVVADIANYCPNCGAKMDEEQREAVKWNG